MNNKSEYLIDKIFQKLIKNQNRKINLKKDEFKKFIKYLMNNSK